MPTAVRRVVVTGLGVVTSLGHDVKSVWKKVLAGECGINKITDPDYENVTPKIGAIVSQDYGGFVAKEWISKLKERRVISSEILFSYAAASKALEDAKWDCIPTDEKESSGVAIGCGLVSLKEIIDQIKVFEEKGQRKISPYLIPKLLINTPAAIISMEFGLQGPNLATSTACSAGSHAIGEAFRLIRNGDSDLMVTAGTEGCISPVIVGAFARINALTTKFNENPKEASRPFDKDRSGFVMAEGAAALILEEYEHAKRRNADIYAEILGYGLSGDAYHLTSPSEDGRGAIRCMKAALRDANLQPKDISYINAHATSTPVGDAVENRAIKVLFNDHAKSLKVSSTKGSTGHLMGAAGAIEAVFTTLAVKQGVAPPTLNFHEVSSKLEFNLNYVANKPQELSANDNGRYIALSNSFGFGGTNACLCIGELK